MFPGLREVVVDLAHRFDIPAVRVTRTSSRGPVGRMMRRLAATLERELQADGIAFPGDAAGLEEAGRLDETALLRALDRFALADASSIELSGHPGEADDDERYRYRWGYQWRPARWCAVAARAPAVERHGFRLYLPRSSVTKR